MAAIILYYLDNRFDIVCALWFRYRHPACKTADPARYERAYRDKLHRDF